MGRVTSAFLKGLDMLNENIILIATTNLYEALDRAMIRRFDATVSFDRYSKDDLIEIADSLLTANIKRSSGLKQDLRLFNKMLKNLDTIAFSDGSNEYDYLRRIFLALNGNSTTIEMQTLKNQGYTTREIEILSRIPKSSVSRKLKEN